MNGGGDREPPPLEDDVWAADGFWLGCHFSLDVWLLEDCPCFGGTHARVHKGSTN